MLEELELLCAAAGIKTALYDKAILYPWIGGWSCCQYKDLIEFCSDSGHCYYYRGIENVLQRILLEVEHAR